MSGTDRYSARQFVASNFSVLSLSCHINLAAKHADPCCGSVVWNASVPSDSKCDHRWLRHTITHKSITPKGAQMHEGGGKQTHCRTAAIKYSILHVTCWCARIQCGYSSGHSSESVALVYSVCCAAYQPAKVPGLMVGRSAAVQHLVACRRKLAEQGELGSSTHISANSKCWCCDQQHGEDSSDCTKPAVAGVLHKHTQLFACIQRRICCPGQATSEHTFSQGYQLIFRLQGVCLCLNSS